MNRGESKLVLLLKNVFSKFLIDKDTLNRVTFSYFQKHTTITKSEIKPPLVVKVQQNDLHVRTLSDRLAIFVKDPRNLSEFGKRKFALNQTKSKELLIEETAKLVGSVTKANDTRDQLEVIGELSEFLIRNPAMRYVAAKEGILRLLTNIREADDDVDLQAVIRVALASLGYPDPLKGWGIRILAIDGGGIRGLIAIEILKKLEELTNRRAHELFDYICGVSTGAIITCSLGAYQRDLDSVKFYYKEVSNKIFSQNVFVGTGNLVWSHGYYDTELWEKMIKKYFGEFIRLVDTVRNPLTPKIAVVSAIVNKSSLSPYVFRNYVLPTDAHPHYTGSCEHFIWEAIRASAAAPTYFHEFRLGNLLHQDGAITANNPTAIAIHEAKQIWPHESLQCVVSLGTGRFRQTDLLSDPKPDKSEDSNVSSWTNKLVKLLDSATDTQRVHTILNDLLPTNVYYRINPYLTEVVSMTEIRPEKLKMLEQDVQMYIRRNDDKLREVALILTKPRSRVQRTNDWVSLQKVLFDL